MLLTLDNTVDMIDITLPLGGSSRRVSDLLGEGANQRSFQWFHLRIRTLPGYADPPKGRVLLTVHNPK
jgi:hypothetical protein